MSFPRATVEQLTGEIRAKLSRRPHTSTWHDYQVAPDQTAASAYTLILGAGFSYGVVPLTRELMRQSIGGYYIPDQDQSSGPRTASVLEEHSASFWADFNKASELHHLPTVRVDRRGLPTDPGEAYRTLFMYKGANSLFSEPAPARKPSYLERLQQQRQHGPDPKSDPIAGKQFVQGFLRYVMDVGSENGWGSTGRTDLNRAHRFLANLLQAQQCGAGWSTCAFCRTIFTTNFDTLLQSALQEVRLAYLLTDRPDKLDREDLCVDETAIHLVYTHGSILRRNAASTMDEIDGLAKKNVTVLRDYLQTHDIIVIGYSGWDDCLMGALLDCDASEHKVYWCDICSSPNERISTFLQKRGDGATYVQLKAGADGLMRSIYDALVGVKAHAL